MWTKKQTNKFQTPNYSKEYFRKPVVLSLIGNIKSKKIIEFGCGSGYWTRLFAKKGAKCVGIDSSKLQIDLAKKEEERCPLGIKYFNENIANLKGVKSKSFDIVFIEFVLLEIPNRNLLKKIFKEANRVLKKDGVLFISDMHPFDPIVHNRFKLPKNFNYFQSGTKMIAYAKQLDNTLIKFVDYHWTLEDYISNITGAGFVITSIMEPKPSKKIVKRVPYLKYRETIPKDIIIIGKRI